MFTTPVDSLLCTRTFSTQLNGLERINLGRFSVLSGMPFVSKFVNFELDTDLCILNVNCCV